MTTLKEKLAILESSRHEQNRRSHIEEFKTIDRDDERNQEPKDDGEEITLETIKKMKKEAQEAKMAIDHKHRIDIRGIKGGFTETPRNEGQVGRWAKIWLLNAKNINGNGWGVSPDTIDYNIKYFVNRPYVITSKEWFPESIYETYDHPILPTGDIRKLVAHQEPYRVGTIREINKEGEDYYAIIEVLPKFANRRLPAFCSPSIFAVDYREPEDRLTKWIPLHLAGLDQSPAYGARIALLKGTCIGTPNACRIQLKTAKQLGTEFETICPIKTNHIEETLQKLGAIGIDLPNDKDLPDNKSFKEYRERRKKDEERYMESGAGRFKKIRDFYHTTKDKDITIPEEPLADYLYNGTKTRPPKPKQSDFNKIISAKAEESNQPVKLDKIIEWHRGNNVSKRQHGIDPNRHNDNETLEISKLPWEKLTPEQQKLFITAYSFRHADADVTDILGCDPRSNSKEYWDTLNPSMREHILDPHQLLGIRQMVEKEYDKLEPGEKEQADKVFNDRHAEASKNPTKSAAEEPQYSGEGLHPNANKVHEELRKRTENVNNPIPSKTSMFMTPQGEFVGDGTEHYRAIKDLGGMVGIDTKPHIEEGGRIVTKGTDDYMPDFLKRTGLIRVQSFPRRQKYSFHVATSPTVSQLRSIRDVEKSDPNATVGYAVQSNKGTDVDPESGFRGLMTTLRQHGLVKESKLLMAQLRLADKIKKAELNEVSHICTTCGKDFTNWEEMNKHANEHPYHDIQGPFKKSNSLRQKLADLGEENMTYQDSKPMKVRKKLQKLATDETMVRPYNTDETIVFRDTKKKLKQKLAAIGIDFEEKSLEDIKKKHQLIQQKIMNTPQTKPTQEDFSKIISAKQKLAKIEYPSFDEVKSKFNSKSVLDFKSGFTYLPDEDKHYDTYNDESSAEHFRKKFGDGKNPLHSIATTNIEGEKLTDEHRQHYDKLLNEGKQPHIGGYTNSKGKSEVDIGTTEPMSDEEAVKRLGDKQEGSSKTDTTGKAKFFSNPNFKSAKINEDPLHIIYQGKLYQDFSELPFNTLTAKSEGDWSKYDLVLTNTSDNRIYDLEVKTNGKRYRL
jgi:hypothetical protein